MYSQIDIRYKISQTINDVRSIVNAFPGDLTLCLENHRLYQYVEYAAGATIPADDGSVILQTTDITLRSRWVALEAFADNCFSFAFETTDWTLVSASNVYTLTLTLPAEVTNINTVVYDSTNTKVYPENIQYVQGVAGISGVVLTVGAVPDCTFNGTVKVFFSGLK